MKLRVGDLVEVRSKDEILNTLDKKGELDRLPFMPEMFQFCGKRFRVYKRAHKTCDTVFPVRGRRMAHGVHLETRCDGEAHGECKATCLIFWKEAWLLPVNGNSASHASDNPESEFRLDRPQNADGCTEQDVWSGTRVSENGDDADPTYICQATQLPFATTDLDWWDVRQYIEDYTSGNVGLWRMACGFIYMGYLRLINLGIGLGAPLRWLYDVFQNLSGGVPYPRRDGIIPAGERTPTVDLGLQPGEWVRVKSYKDILATCDHNLMNRGMWFDAELVPYCGKTYRVLKCVTKIINERTGKIQDIKNPAVILDSVFCQARYSECRLFCPRSLYSFWREIWLERANEPSCNHTTAMTKGPIS